MIFLIGIGREMICRAIAYKTSVLCGNRSEMAGSLREQRTYGKKEKQNVVGECATNSNECTETVRGARRRPIGH